MFFPTEIYILTLKIVTNAVGRITSIEVVNILIKDLSYVGRMMTIFFIIKTFHLWFWFKWIVFNVYIFIPSETR